MMRLALSVLMIGLIGCGEDSNPIAMEDIQLVHFEDQAALKEPPIDPKVAITRAALLRPDDLSGRFALTRIGMPEATVLTIMGPPHRAELPEAIIWSGPEDESGGLGSYSRGQDHYRLGIRHGKVFCKQIQTTGFRGYAICGNDIQFKGRFGGGGGGPVAAPAPRAKPCGGKKR